MIIAPINQTTAENALQLQVSTACALAGDHVIWNHQSRDRVPRPFVVLTWLGDRVLAPATPVESVDDNPTPTAGKEIVISASDDMEFQVRIDTYAESVTGSASALAVARKIARYLGRDDCSAALDAAGVAIIEAGAISSVPALLETKFEGRAQFTVRCRARDAAQEETTYIQSVNPITKNYT